MLKLAWNRKHEKNAGRVGISLASDGFTLCHIEAREEGAPPRLRLCRSFSALTPEERKLALRKLVAESNLQGLPCVVVLPSELYSLRLLDRPNVEADEIASSLPYLIKDVIDFDPGEARVDYFEFPSDATRGRSARIFVAAVRKSVVAEVADLLDESGLELSAIDIAELASRNLLEEMPQQVAGSVLLDLGPKGGRLTICHESQIYFARAISTGTSQIDDALGNEIALDECDDQLSDHVRSLLDQLLVEIQRSLDYYESELGKAPACRLTIAPSTAEISLYIPYLTELLRPVSVGQLDLNTLVDSDEVLSNELQSTATLALGGALRGDLEQQLDLRAGAGRAPGHSTLGVAWVAKACALMFCGLIAVYGFGIHQNGKFEASLEANLAQHELNERQLTSLEESVAQSDTSTTGIDPLAPLRAKRDRTARTLRQLDELGGNRREGFSKYFGGFARQSIPNLWLTRIEVQDGGESLSIHGSTLAAKQVPLLLRRLRSEASFAGKTFSLFRLTSNEEGPFLDFALESESAAEAM